MKKLDIIRFRRKSFLTVSFFILLIFYTPAFSSELQQRPDATKVIKLPEPNLSGFLSLEEAINSRRSVRQFSNTTLDYVQIGQLAWAGQGITDKGRGYRAAPSALAAYPIVLYFALPDGLYVYHPEEHSIERIMSGDIRNQLSLAFEQKAPGGSACNIIITGSQRKLAKAGKKAERFMLLEAGHVSENIQLQTVSLGLVSVPVGDFDVRKVARTCILPVDLQPLLVICVGLPIDKQQEVKNIEIQKRAVLIVPGKNFIDAELFDTRRVLTEAGIETIIASSAIGPLEGTFGGYAVSDISLNTLNVDDYDAVVFMDGPASREYFKDPVLLNIATAAYAGRKIVAAISMAPAILANAGVLKGIRATGYITERDVMLQGGAEYSGTSVERDGLIITASDPSSAVTFARTIVIAIKQRPLPPSGR